MADKLLVRIGKRIGNAIIDVSLKALILAMAAAIAGAVTVIWLALRSSPHSPWFYGVGGALCAVLGFGLILASLVGLRLRQVRKTPAESLPQPQDQEQLVAKLTEAQSLLKHWTGEAGRVENEYKGQLKLSEDRRLQSKERARTLQNDLELAEAKLDEFKAPRLRLKIKRAEYHMLGKVGLDVTGVLDQMVLDERLVLSVPYDEIFRPDPQPHVYKHLTIDFSHGIREFSVTVPQNAKITLPFPYQLKETA